MTSSIPPTRFSIRDGRLAVRGWRDNYGTLRPVIADGFSLRPPSMPPAFVRFARDGQKRVTGFTLSNSGCKDIGFAKAAERPAGTSGIER